MLKFRIKMLQNILSAPDPGHIANAMNEIMTEMAESEVSDKRFSQYIKCVKADIFFHLRLKQSRREFNNLTQALKIIQEEINFEIALNQ